MMYSLKEICNFSSCFLLISVKWFRKKNIGYHDRGGALRYIRISPVLLPFSTCIIDQIPQSKVMMQRLQNTDEDFQRQWHRHRGESNRWACPNRMLFFVEILRIFRPTWLFLGDFFRHRGAETLPPALPPVIYSFSAYKQWFLEEA